MVRFLCWPHFGMTSEWPNDPEMNGMIAWTIGFWDGMTDWSRNENDFRIKGSALILKYPLISLSSRHSWSFMSAALTSDWTKCSLNDVLSIEILIPRHSKPPQMMREWRIEAEWRRFSMSGFFDSSHSGAIWSFRHHFKITSRWWHIKVHILPWNDEEWGRNGLIGCCLL